MDKQMTAEEMERLLEARRAEYRAWQESPEFQARVEAHRAERAGARAAYLARMDAEVAAGTLDRVERLLLEVDGMRYEAHVFADSKYDATPEGQEDIEYYNVRYAAIVAELAALGQPTDPIAAPTFTGLEHWYEEVNDQGDATPRRAWCRLMLPTLRVMMTAAERQDTACPLCEASEALLASDGTGEDVTDPDQVESRKYEENLAGRELAAIAVTLRADWRRMEMIEAQMQSYGELRASLLGEVPAADHAAAVAAGEACASREEAGS